MERVYDASRVTTTELKAIGRGLRSKLPDPIKQEKDIIPLKELPKQYRLHDPTNNGSELEVGEIIAPVYLDDCDGMPSEAWEVKVGDSGKYLERTPEALSRAKELRSQTAFTYINQFLK